MDAVPLRGGEDSTRVRGRSAGVDLVRKTKLAEVAGLSNPCVGQGWASGDVVCTLPKRSDNHSWPSWHMSPPMHRRWESRARDQAAVALQHQEVAGARVARQVLGHALVARQAARSEVSLPPTLEVQGRRYGGYDFEVGLKYQVR